MTHKGQPLEKLQEYEKLIQQTEYDVTSSSARVSHQACIWQSVEDLCTFMTKQQAAIDNVSLGKVLSTTDFLHWILA